MVGRRGSIHKEVLLRDVTAGCLGIHQPGNSQRAYKAVVRVQPVKHFALLPSIEQQGMLSAFRGLLARLPVSEEISIHVRVRPYDITPYLDRLEQAQHTASPALRDLAADHHHFVQGLASERALLQHEFFVRLTASQQQASHQGKRKPSLAFELAKADLDRKTQILLEELQRCGLAAHRLGSEELIEYYRSCLHLSHAQQHPLSPENLAAVNQPIRENTRSTEEADAGIQDPETTAPRSASTALVDAAPSENAQDQSNRGERRWIWQRGKTLARHQRTLQRQATTTLEPAPHLISLLEILQPSLIEAHRHYLCVHHETSEYSRARAVIGYPRQLTAGWFDRLLTLDEPFVELMLFIEKRNPVTVTRHLTNKISKLRANQWIEWRAGRTENAQTQATRDDIEPLRDALVRQEEHVHAVSLYLCSRASSVPELKARDQRVAALLESLELVSVETTYEHLHAWRSFLPDAIDVLKRRRLLDTSSLVTAFPFTVCNLSTPEPGMLVGTTATRGPVLIHPSSMTLENGHELIIASSGAGKSFYLKLWLLRALHQGIASIVIDPEDEYALLCREVGGTVIRLAPGAFPLNPFDLVSLPGEHRLLEEKVEGLLTLLDLLLADKASGVVSQREKGFLNRMLFQIYADRGITADPATHQRTPPTMADLFERIMEERDPYHLGERLQRHLSAFPNRTTVGLDASLIVFSIRDLPAELKPVGLYVVTEFVWNTIRQETSPRPRFLMVDEAWTLMQFPEGGEFLSNLSRRARKYHLHLKLCTQNAEDFLASKAGRVIVQNSAMKMLLKQDASTIEAIAKAFALSPEESAYLPSCRPGEGLFMLRAARTPLFAAASHREYQLATTNPQERWQAAQDHL
jgi:hypothetical protein